MQWRKIMALAARMLEGRGAGAGRRLLEFAKRTSGRVGRRLTPAAEGTAPAAAKATRRVAKAALMPENTGRWYDHWGVMLVAGALGTHYALDRLNEAVEKATLPDFPSLTAYGAWVLGASPVVMSPDPVTFGAGFAAGYVLGGRVIGTSDFNTPTRALYGIASEAWRRRGEKGMLAAVSRKADAVAVDVARIGMRMAFSAAVGSLVYDTAVRTAAGMVAALARPAPRPQPRRRSVQSRPTISRAVRVNPEATGDLVLALHRTGGKGMVIRR